MQPKDKVLRQFETRFGAWTHREEFHRTTAGEPSVWVYEWPRSNFGMKTFATVGFCDEIVPETDDIHRLEFMYSSRRETFDDAANILLTACATPLDDGEPLRAGHTIGPLREPIGAGLTRLFLTEPWEPEDFLRIDLGSDHAQVLMVVPLHEGEFRLLRERGEEELWSSIEGQGLDITDSQRASAVTPT
jgi:hypothetical protein